MEARRDGAHRRSTTEEERMLNFFVATKTGSTRFQHDNGPIEFGRKSEMIDDG
jgi:hypothetical protein